MNNMPKIAVVIVNWNKMDQVISLLSQIEKVSTPDFDVYVVDNASEDDSVDAIKAGFPKITLLVNNVNTGGTGGFNQGIAHVVERRRYSYVWLLDNDAVIEENTLRELLNVMEADERIGVAGSRIVDTDQRNVTVETGGNFRWDMVGVTPLNRNTTLDFDTSTGVIDVDYVAVCSALIRLKTLEQVGLMDDRMFLLWDDMDWGLCFKERGFRVVAVPQSIVYHQAFSEKNRGSISNYYYGLRNGLLTYSKHAKFRQRALIFFQTLKYHLRIFFFLKTHDQHYNSLLMVNAYRDYCNNRWGKFVINNTITEEDNLSGGHSAVDQPGVLEKILVIAIGSSYSDTIYMMKLLKEICRSAQITVLVNDDQINFYAAYNTFAVNRKRLSSLIYLFNVFFRLKREKFDSVAAIAPSPFIYVARRALFYNQDNQTFRICNTGSIQFIQLCFSLCMAEFLAFILWPILMLKSLRYQKGP